MEAVSAHALVVIGARQRECVIDKRMAAMEGGVEAGDLRVDGKAFIAARIPAILCGSCSGASGMSPFSVAITDSSISFGSTRCRPPCTTRWPTAATESHSRPAAASREWRPSRLDGRRGGARDRT